MGQYSCMRRKNYEKGSGNSVGRCDGVWPDRLRRYTDIRKRTAEGTAQESSAAADNAAAESTAAESVQEEESSTQAQSADAAADGEGRQFIVGFDAEFPPYGYKDESGEYVGFDLDLAAEVCKRQGWELVKQPIDWDSKDMELDSGAIDCIWNGFTMNGREDQYTFSVPYVDNSQVFVVAEDAGIETKADLAGKAVGVQKDSSALAALEGDEKALARYLCGAEPVCGL